MALEIYIAMRYNCFVFFWFQRTVRKGGDGLERLFAPFRDSTVPTREPFALTCERTAK